MVEGNRPPRRLRPGLWVQGRSQESQSSAGAGKGEGAQKGFSKYVVGTRKAAKESMVPVPGEA